MNRFIALFLLFAGFVFPGYSQQRIASYHIEKTSKWTAKVYENDPLKTREYTFLNGLTLITSYNAAQPRINSMVAVKTGSRNDPADHTGLAHYLEHMLFKGTDKYGTADWNTEKRYLSAIDSLYEVYNKTTLESRRKLIYRGIDSLSQIAATYAIANEYDKMCQAIGATGTNAFTGEDMTVYVNDFPSNMLHKWVLLEAERYRNPVLRLFHTELEAVYEEKNISLDNDHSKVWEKMNAELYTKHNYGLQTTIGTIEHLKNPSLVAIREYYKTWYVPNNMAVILAGDFDPDVAADAIAEHFGYMKPSTLPEYTFSPEPPHASPRQFDVYGPDAEYVYVGYRLPSKQFNNGRDIRAARIIDLLLSNSSAGLMDLNLVKQQKVLAASSFIDHKNDYSTFVLTGTPREGQTLEEVRDLLISQVQLIMKGEFEDELFKAVILNEEISRIRQFKENENRAYFLMEAFVQDKSYMDAWNELWDMQRMRKEEIIEIAREYLDKDRVEVFKRIGKDSSVQKIEKPEIHPVELNRDKQSAFVAQWLAEPSSEITPVFADFSKIQTLKTNQGVELLYVKNTENRLFNFQLAFETGRLMYKSLPLALKYLKLCGTEKLSATELSKAFYRLGCQFEVWAGGYRSYITLSGPEESFTEAYALLFDLVTGAKAEEGVLQALIADEQKSRADAKLNNRIIASRLSQYALYGSNNPSNWVLTSQELATLTSDALLKTIKQLGKVRGIRYVYFGQRADNEVAALISEKPMYRPELVTASPDPVFKPIMVKEPEVLFVDYDMVQANVYWTSGGPDYNQTETPVIDGFNQYFGGDMSSVVFQSIRESKALAYSTYAFYNKPERTGQPFYMMAFVGTQADKFHEAVNGMQELLQELPLDEGVFALSRESLINRIRTERIDDESLTGYWFSMRDLGLSEDYRVAEFSEIQHLTMEKIRDFHRERVAKLVYRMGVLADGDLVTEKDLSKYGRVIKLTLTDIFGY